MWGTVAPSGTDFTIQNYTNFTIQDETTPG